MPAPSIAISLAQNFERFNPRIDVFNHDSLTRQCSVEPLLLRRQRMALALFVRYGFDDSSHEGDCPCGEDHEPAFEDEDLLLEEELLLEEYF